MWQVPKKIEIAFLNMVRKNTKILSGIYTQPLQWFSVGMFGEGEKDRIIYIETIDEPKLFDNGANRPTDTLRGFGSSEWNKFYCDALNKLGYSIKSSIMTGGKEDCKWYFKNKDVIEKFFNNWDDRIKFEKIYLQWLLQQNYQIVVNGGELIIIDVSCILRISKNQTTWVKY